MCYGWLFSLTFHLSIAPEIQKQSSFRAVVLQQEIFKRSWGKRVCNNGLDVGAVTSPGWKTICWSRYVAHRRHAGRNDALSQIVVITSDRSPRKTVSKWYVTAWCTYWHWTCTETSSSLTVPLCRYSKTTAWSTRSWATAERARIWGHYAFQGHWFWYQSKARMRLPISE